MALRNSSSSLKLTFLINYTKFILTPRKTLSKATETACLLNREKKYITAQNFDHVLIILR